MDETDVRIKELFSVNRNTEGKNNTAYISNGSKTVKSVFNRIILIYTLLKIYVIFFAINFYLLKI